MNKSPKPPWIFTCTVINELLNEEEIEKEKARKGEGRTGENKSKEFGNAKTTGLARKWQTSNEK